MTRLMSSLALTLSSRPAGAPAWLGLAVLLLAALLLGLQVPLARADGIIVTSAADTLNSGDGQCTLREAILNANNNDQTGSIDCAPGGGSADIITFADNYNITLTTNLPVLSSTLTLDSAGRRVTVSGNNARRVFRIEAGAVVTMSHLSIMRGRVTGNGSGILNEGTLALLNSTLNNNVANNGTGGGIHNTGTLTVTNSTLSSNSANNGGGIHNTGTLTVTNGTLSGNSAANNGGGLNNTGTVYLRNTLIANSPDGDDCSNTGTIASHLNNLIEDGSCNTGATGFVTGDPDLDPLQDNGGTTLTHALQFGSPAIDAADNGICPAADQRGVGRPIGPICDIGAVEALPCAALPPVTVTTINDSGPGSLRQALAEVCDGGTVNFDASLANQTINLISAGLSLTNSVTITNPNAANLKVSGSSAHRLFTIQAGAVVTISNLSIINGSSAENGGGIRNSGTLTLLNSTLSGHLAALSGGAIDNLGLLTISHSTLTGNTAGIVGGGIANGGTLTLLNSTLSGNSAPNGGGGIDNLGILTVTNSTLNNNTAPNGNGGGIFNSLNTLILLNSTLSGNSALSGGGIDNAGTLTATNSTLSGNSATSGGGIRNSTIGTLHLRNSLIANSLNGGDCANTGTLASHLNNLIEDGSCSTGAVGFVTGDPKLGSLQYNGGPSTGQALLTHALLSGSPAIDAGDNSVCPATDQRGVARPNGPACDIGAFEALPCTDTLTVTTPNDSGPGSLRQALVDVCGGGTIDFAASLANQTISLTSTELSIAQTVTLTNPNAPNLQVSGNEAHRVFNIQAGTVVISNLGIINGAAGDGGGILVSSEAELMLLNSSLSGNSAGLDGGGINNSGTLTVTNSPVSDNSAGGSGGGIHNAGTLTIASSTLNDNSANNSGGGGIANFGGTLTVLDITLSDNSANNSGGGGIANFEGTLTLLNSTLSDNSAEIGGGLSNSGTLTLLNSTFSGNSADTGGGLSNSGTLTMTNSTLSDNSADTGGGIDNSGSLHLSNSLIANSPDGGDCSNTGAIVAHLNNLIEDGSCETGAINLVTGDPNLGPLQDNGGPSIPGAGQVTLTHALLDGSPAIDAGDNLICPATDQRGVTRPIGLACDIGAFEAGSTCFPAVTVTSSGDDGPGSLRRALTDVCDGGTIDFAANLANQTISLTSTELSITKTMTLTNPNAANLKISGNEAQRVFHIQAGVVVTMSHLGIISGTTTERGGGILNDGTLTLLNSTLSGNLASDQGGGIHNNGTLILLNSTLSGNLALSGGGINNSGTLMVTHSTLSGNSAFDDDDLLNIGGGLLNNFGGILHLYNSLIANSPSGGDCDNLGIIVTHLNTLIEDGSCSSGAAGFVTGDPNLGPLQDNGGQTLTHALLPGSPAIDAGDNGVCPAIDQRGVARPIGSGCDLGAYEAQAQTLPAATLYLPLLLKSVVTAPDLVVDSLAAAGSSVTLVIKNQGDAPVVDAFWVDVYLNPTTAPTGVNQEWHELGSQGLVWGIVGSTLPLDPDESLTLTIGDPFYRADLSSFTPPLPAGSPVYAQVDSANLLTDYGGVLEDHEISGRAYNNIAVTTASKGEAGPAAPGAGATPPPASDEVLPPR